MKKEESSVLLEEPADTVDENVEKGNLYALQQNNIYINHINLKELDSLAEKNPELAKKYLEIVEKVIQSSEKAEKEIINLEKQEQRQRHENIPYQRKYAYRGQILSFATIVVSFVAAGYFAYIGMEKATIAAIAIPIGIVAVNFIGIKNKDQK